MYIAWGGGKLCIVYVANMWAYLQSWCRDRSGANELVAKDGIYIISEREKSTL